MLPQGRQLEFFYLPFMALIAVPPLAIVPSVLFGLCLRRHRARLTRSGTAWVVTAVLSWLVYTVYECAVWIWSQSVTAPIRVDLLVIAPMLYVLSFLGFRACWRVRFSKPLTPGL